jgi:hypothetical protein
LRNSSSLDSKNEKIGFLFFYWYFFYFCSLIFF